MKKPFVIEDLLKINCLNSMTLNSKGTYAFFNQVEADLKTNKNPVRLFLLERETEKVRQLTYTASHSNVIWDDDTTLLMQTERTAEDSAKPAEEKSVFYRLRADGGEAVHAFSIDRVVIGMKKYSEGVYLLQIEENVNRVDPKADPDGAVEELDYHVIEEAPFWTNNVGFTSGFHNGLYLYKESDGSLERITADTLDVNTYVIDGTKIAYTGKVRKFRGDSYGILNVYDTETKETVSVVADHRMSVRTCTFRNHEIVFLASDMKTWGSHQLPDWYLADPSTGSYRLMRKNTEELSFFGMPSSENLRPAGNVFKALGDDIYFTALWHGVNDLYRLDANGKIEIVLPSDEGGIVCFDLDEKGTVSIQAAHDYFNVAAVNGKTVYDPNAELLADREISATIPHTIINRNGDEIEGCVIPPYNYDPEKKYPAVLMIHGGPRAAYGRMLSHEMQVAAGKGMFVVYCNPRGGDSYGEAFGDLRGKYGTIDFDDLMDYLDEVLELYPAIDPARLGAAGGSYGGFMCNWLEGHTDRFAAIASQCSISNWLSDFGTSELGLTFDLNEMMGDPWTRTQEMWDASPIKYACNAKTPILFIHSTVDYNVMIEQGAQMYTAMKYFGVPSRMVVFEGEGHSLVRVGKPKHRIRNQKEIFGWFDQYLV